jgi:hypothetical protein
MKKFAAILIGVACLAGADGRPAARAGDDPSPGSPPTVAALEAAIRTPPAPPAPRINGPTVYGVRPGSPFLYRVPCTGERPLAFTAQGLPDGLTLDRETGIIRVPLPCPVALLVPCVTCPGGTEAVQESVARAG